MGSVGDQPKLASKEDPSVLHGGAPSDEDLPGYQAVAEQPVQPAPDFDIDTEWNHTIRSETDPLKSPIDFSVTQGTCLAHLKLLHAFQSMKEDVGFTDGLWGIWDSMATEMKHVPADLVSPDANLGKMTEDEKKMALLSKLREKRWALFVARAVDRYEAWWAAQPVNYLVQEERGYWHFPGESVNSYTEFPSGKKMVWEPSMLPPLGQSLL